MTTASAILVGLKQVDPNAYGNGWDGKKGCGGCEFDVDRVGGILKPLNYSILPLNTTQATKGNVLGALRSVSSTLKSGDILVFYFTGHGGQQPDLNGDERDRHDETLCLFDGAVIDDQLDEIWLSFKSGVRIVMISDSCNSGTNYKMIRHIPSSEATPIIPMDDEIKAKMEAQLIHFGACLDGFSAYGYPTGSIFTAAMLEIWNGGAFDGNYLQFLKAIRHRVTGQIPQYNEYGQVTESFRNQKPFTVD